MSGIDLSLDGTQLTRAICRFSTLNLFANQLLVCGLLEQSGHDGFIGNATILRGNQNSVMDIVVSIRISSHDQAED